MEEGNARYVGVDVAKATMVVRIIKEDEKGFKIIRWHGKTDGKGRENLIKMLMKNDVVGIEAGEPAFTIAREIRDTVGANVLPLNPGKLAVIYRSMRKTDADDALKLARLVMRIPENELPVVAIPSEEERMNRAIVSEDDFLKTTRTRIILRLHSVYVRAGITQLTRKDLKVAEKRRLSLELLSGKPEYFRKEAERLERLLVPVEEEIEMVETEVTNELQKNDLAPILMSVPGVGPAMAMVYLAHIGKEDRFGNAAQVSNYVGFVPRLDFSGKTERSGHITKRGCKHIRRIAVQSAWALVRSKQGGALKEKYLDLRTRRGKKIAIVAIAKKMVELLWVMAGRKELYKYSTPEELKIKFRGYGLKFKGSAA